MSDYGRAKLRQEQTLATWSRQRPDVSTIVVRVSNLYGPGQRLDKPQGLISHMARSVIYGRPIHIFVPLDTVRDYLFAEDAGVAMARWTERLGEEARRGRARRATSSSSAPRRGTRPSPRSSASSGASPAVRSGSSAACIRARPCSPLQLRFRSRVWTDQPAFRTGLLEGISRVYREQLSLYQVGSLVPPSAHLPLAASQTPRANPIA